MISNIISLSYSDATLSNVNDHQSEHERAEPAVLVNKVSC